MIRLLLIFFSLATTFSHAFADKNVKYIKKELVKITHEIQTIESAFDSSTNKMINSLEMEGAVVKDINIHQLSLSRTLQQARSFVKNSPLLLIAMPVSVSDIIHSYMLMNSALPQIQKKKETIIESLKRVQKIRLKRSSLQKKQKNIAIRYEDLRAKQDQLIFQKKRLLKIKTFARTKTDDTDLQSTLLGIVTMLDSKHSRTTKVSSLRLSKPIMAKTFHEDIHQPLTQVFESRPSAQAISPWEATVVYVSYNKSGDHTVITKQGNFYMIINGLGSVSCNMGEDLLKGEPIGRMPRFNGDKHQAIPTNLTMPLKIHLYKGQQQIDPKPYFNT